MVKLGQEPADAKKDIRKKCHLVEQYNIGEFSYLDYLEEKSLVNGLIMDIKDSIRKILVICQ